MAFRDLDRSLPHASLDGPLPGPTALEAAGGASALAVRCLQVAYDGSEFHGWQGQEGLRTVHGTLQAALKGCHPLHGRGLLATHLVGCSRTDRGVHAEAQVAHVDLHDSLEAATLLRRCNGRLPGDVRLVAAEPVAKVFHARSSARLKCQDEGHRIGTMEALSLRPAAHRGVALPGALPLAGGRPRLGAAKRGGQQPGWPGE